MVKGGNEYCGSFELNEEMEVDDGDLGWNEIILCDYYFSLILILVLKK